VYQWQKDNNKPIFRGSAKSASVKETNLVIFLIINFIKFLSMLLRKYGLRHIQHDEHVPEHLKLFSAHQAREILHFSIQCAHLS